MKKALLLTVAIVCVASIAFAQPGYLGVYSDPGGTNCTGLDLPNGFLPLYVIHQATAGAGALQAGVQASFPAGLIHLGETSPYATTIGSMWVHDEGLGGSVAFGACVGSPNLVKTINVLTLGFSPPCSSICAVVDPSALTGTIEIVDCGNNKLVGAGACMWINTNGTCNVCVPPVPTEESSWGRLKALYN